MFFQKDIETMPRRELEALQLERLRHLVDYCHKNVPFYRDRLDAAGVTAEKITALSDIQSLPLTTKADIRDHYPYGLNNKELTELYGYAPNDAFKTDHNRLII